MTPIEWDNLLVKPWRDAYPVVFDQTKALLAGKVTFNLTTTELVEKLYPEHFARGDMIVRRQKIFKALKAAQTHGTLRGYWHLGEEKRYMGKNYRAPVWHHYIVEHDQGDPRETECPVCGHKFIPGGDHAG